MHFRAFKKAKPTATTFIEHIWVWPFVLCVYIEHFIVSTKTGDQTDKPKQLLLLLAQRRAIPAELPAVTIWFFAVTRHLYKPRSLPDFYESQKVVF